MARLDKLRLLFLPLGAALILAGCGGAPAQPPSMEQAQRKFSANDPYGARTELLALLKANPADGKAHLLQGRIYLVLGDGIAAEAEILRARETGIAVGETHHLLAHALLLQGETTRALREAASADGKYKAAGLRIAGRTQAAMGDNAAALRTLEDGIALDAADAGLWADRGRVLLATKDAAGAADAAKHALAIDARNVDAMMLNAEIARGAGEPERALGWFDRALKIFPHYVPAMLGKAALLGDVGQPQAMLDLAREVLQLDAKNPYALFLEARHAVAKRDYPAARDLMQQTGTALDRNPAAMLLNGEIALRLGNNEAAIEAMNRLLATEPGNNSARQTLGIAQWGVGDALSAVATLQPLADRNLASREAIGVLAKAMESLGDKRAMAYATRAKLPNPRLVADQLVAADRALKAGRWSEAVRRYESLRGEIGKRDPMVANNLAWAYFKSGDVARALPISAEAYRTAPANASIADTHGWLLHVSGKDRARGLAVLRDATKAAPANLTIRWHLAQALAEQGHKEEARRELAALIAAPAFAEKEQARVTLARL